MYSTQTAQFAVDVAFYVPRDFHPRAFLPGRPTMEETVSASVFNSHVLYNVSRPLLTVNIKRP